MAEKIACPCGTAYAPAQKTNHLGSKNHTNGLALRGGGLQPSPAPASPDAATVAAAPPTIQIVDPNAADAADLDGDDGDDDYDDLEARDVTFVPPDERPSKRDHAKESITDRTIGDVPENMTDRIKDALGSAPVSRDYVPAEDAPGQAPYADYVDAGKDGPDKGAQPDEPDDELSRMIGDRRYQAKGVFVFDWCVDTEGHRWHFSRYYYYARILVDRFASASESVLEEVASKSRQIAEYNADVEPEARLGYFPYVVGIALDYGALIAAMKGKKPVPLQVTDARIPMGMID